MLSLLESAEQEEWLKKYFHDQNIHVYLSMCRIGDHLGTPCILSCIVTSDHSRSYQNTPAEAKKPVPVFKFKCEILGVINSTHHHANKSV